MGLATLQLPGRLSSSIQPTARALSTIPTKEVPVHAQSSLLRQNLTNIASPVYSNSVSNTKVPQSPAAYCDKVPKFGSLRRITSQSNSLIKNTSVNSGLVPVDDKVFGTCAP